MRYPKLGLVIPFGLVFCEYAQASDCALASKDGSVSPVFLLGAAIAGGVALFVSRQQLKHQRKIDFDKRMLATFESIHEELSDMTNRTGVMSAQVAFMVRAGLPYDSKLMEGRLVTDKLRMLVAFYAP